MEKNKVVNKFARLWMAESSTYNFSVNLSMGFMNAFMIKLLGYDILELGYLVTIRILAIAMSQFPAIFLTMYFRSKRKTIWFIGGAINRIGLALIPLALLLPKPRSFIYLAVLSFTTQFAGGIAGVASADTVGSNIPRSDAPNIFSTVNKLIYISTALSYVIGILIFLLPANLLSEYIVVYSLAFLTAVISTIILYKIPDFNLVNDHSNRFSSNQHIIGTLVLDPKLRRYLYIVTLFNFAVSIPAPFWDYIVLSLAGGREIVIPIKNMASLIAKFFAIGWWQKLMHRKGIRKTLIEGMAFTSLVPLCYYEASNVIEVFMAEVLSGFVWAPVDVGTSIYPVYLPPEDIRPLYLSLTNFLTNSLSAVAATIGTTISATTGNVYSTLLTSAALRAITAGIAYKVLPEIESVEENTAMKH